MESCLIDYKYPCNLLAMSIGARLRLARNRAGMTQKQLEAVSGVKQQIISGLETELYSETADIVQLATALNVSPQWLATGHGPIEPITPTPPVIESNVAPGPEIRLPSPRKIPVRGKAQLGEQGYWCDMEYPPGHGDGYIVLPSKDADAYALKLVGDSMMPRIKSGEFVVIEPNHPIKHGDEVLVTTADGQSMVKEYLFTRDGRVTLGSVNLDHGRITFEQSAIVKMHYVAAIVKSTLWVPE